ncbi:MAG: Gfo/Idh/MocA family protein [Allosphingosinicella sp.]
MSCRIGIVGYGKIAQDQHVPSIEGEPRFALAATVSRGGNGREGVACFTGHEAMIEAGGIDAVAICTPPSARYAIARDCIAAGLHTLLEKPPGVTLGEVEALARLAREAGVSLFTTWHSQHNAAVSKAARILEKRTIARMEIVWREDVRTWHPGQQWIWAPGGFGVFDPGINALAIASRIFPGPLIVRAAELFFPQNRDTPIAAALEFASPAAEGPLTAAFDWRHSGGEAWTIAIRTADGEEIELRDGGARLFRGGAEVEGPGIGEYPDIYRRFGDLIEKGESHVDVEPLRLTADAFLAGKRTIVEPFED